MKIVAVISFTSLVLFRASAVFAGRSSRWAESAPLCWLRPVRRLSVACPRRTNGRCTLVMTRRGSLHGGCRGTSGRSAPSWNAYQVYVSGSTDSILRRLTNKRFQRTFAPAANAIARIAATTKSTAAQNGGHHRVPVTNCVRCCQRSLRPCPVSPATRSQAGPVRAAATTTKTVATATSAAMTFQRPSATLNPMQTAAMKTVRGRRPWPELATRWRTAWQPEPRQQPLPRPAAHVGPRACARRQRGFERMLSRHFTHVRHDPT